MLVVYAIGEVLTFYWRCDMLFLYVNMGNVPFLTLVTPFVTLIFSRHIGFVNPHVNS